MKSSSKILIIGALMLALALPFLQVVLFAGAYNYEHVNVTTQVNVTNAFPEIFQVNADQDIVLNAGNTTTVTCNATIRDWNGYTDISNVNATMYYYLNNSADPDDRNVHYTNASCEEVSNDGEYWANYSCSFEVYYFANNGSWNCNVTVVDNYGFTDTANNTTSINALYALNVTDVIDYGNLSVTDTSEEINATVTNFGNMDINVTVLGYGLTEGDGLGLVCEHGDNISVEYQRFSVTDSVAWADKTVLDEIGKDMGMTIPQPTEASNPETWITHWQLYVPPNPFGLCTGTVRFTATVP